MNALQPHRPAPLPAKFSVDDVGDATQIDDGAGTAIRFGVISMLLFMGVTGFWLYTAPLDSAAIAPGIVKVEGNRKLVQHLDGGIVKEILVREGDLVKRDQVMVRLDPVQPRAAVEILSGQIDAYRAQEARLRAERDNEPAIAFPPDLLARADKPPLSEVIRGERQLFEARRSALEGQFALLRQQSAQLTEQIRGTAAQVAALDRQGELVREELKGTKELHELGYATKTRVLALERAVAAIGGQQAEYRGTVGRLRSAMGQIELQMLQLRKDRITQVTTEFNEIQNKLSDARERLKATVDVLERTEIRAPETGYVVGLNVFTVGGVIQRGDRILEIVPEGSPPIIEARLRPEDAKDVREGQRTELHLLAYKAKDVPIVHGTIKTRSADRLTDSRTGEGYFLIQVIADQTELSALKGVTLAPGMPVEVLIPTGSRTAMEYLVEPILQTLRRSFKEK